MPQDYIGMNKEGSNVTEKFVSRCSKCGIKGMGINSSFSSNIKCKDWYCLNCNINNFSLKTHCSRCGIKNISS